MKKTLHRALFVMLAAAAASPAAAAPGNVPLPKGDRLLLPLDVGTTAYMVWTATGPIDASETPKLLVDEGGHPWYGLSGGRLVDMTRHGMIVVDKPFDDAALTGNGAFLLIVGQELGGIVEPSPEQKAKNRLAMSFRSRMTLPYKGMRLYEGGRDVVYVVGRNPESGKTELFVHERTSGAKFVKLVAVKETIDAVAGDGRTTYFSSGPRVVKIGPDRKRMERALMLEEKYPVSELAYTAKAGLFFATPAGVGFLGAGEKPQMILSAPDASIRIRGNSLFVHFTRAHRILELDGIDGYSKLVGKD